ncbi:MAG: hypothetical protein FK731_02185 [Asgard group archaeon]|nr:hypothetical protein [Asgard group archaeon]
MAWLKKLKISLDKHTKKDVKEKIMEGSEEVNLKSQSESKTEWVKGAIEKIDKLVDKETGKKILLSCCDVFPKTRIKPMKEKYLETSSIDAVLELMHKDSSWGGLSYYEYPYRKGNTIYVTKNPFNPKKYEETKDENMKKYYYCHCGLVKNSLKSGNTKISPIFCYCGAGWYKTLWEGIIEKPVEIEVLQSVVQGDNCCEFAIRLPIEL